MQGDQNDEVRSDNSDDEDNGSDEWKRTFAVNNIDDIMDAIEEIETPDRYLEEIVREYRHNTTDEDATDSETDDETDYYTSDEDDSENDDKDDKDTDTDQGNKSNDEK